jgi:nucleoside-diphosphate-sugar epimerase
MKKHLVLGSKGQIGSALVKYLQQQSDIIVEGLDLENGPVEDLRYPTRYLEGLFEHADFVYFLAYDVGGSRYLAQQNKTLDLIRNNTKIMDTVFTYLEKYKKPFIFASSQMSNMTHSPYGVCKALGEHFTKMIDGRIVQFWNVYGEEHDPEKFHVITDFINKARTTKKINMLTTGQEVRQFLHAEDCSRALLTIAENYSKFDAKTHLHITSFEWNSIREIADIVAWYYPGTEIIPGTHTDNVQNGIINQPDKLLLNYWQPKIKLIEGIKTIIDSYEGN